MVKQNKTIRQLLPRNNWVFDHFVELSLKGLKRTHVFAIQLVA